MKNNMIVPMILALVIGLGGGFFGGMQYQKNQATSGQFRMMGQSGTSRNGMGRFGNGMRPVAGQIIAADSTSITVKMPDGSTKIVVLASSTVFSKSDTATKTDLVVGARVAAFGMQNSDGSLTAQTIQLNPMIRNFGSPSPSGQ